MVQSEDRIFKYLQIWNENYFFKRGIRAALCKEYFSSTTLENGSIEEGSSWAVYLIDHWKDLDAAQHFGPIPSDVEPKPSRIYMLVESPMNMERDGKDWKDIGVLIQE